MTPWTTSRFRAVRKAPWRRPPGPTLAVTRPRRNGTAQPVLIAAVIAGVASILLSTKYLSLFPYGEVIFPWQFPISVLVPVFATGFLLFLYVLLSPAMFWETLMATALLTAGMFVLRFSIFDEWLVGWIAFGGVVAASNGSIRPRRRRRDAGR